MVEESLAGWLEKQFQLTDHTFPEGQHCQPLGAVLAPVQQA